MTELFRGRIRSILPRSWYERVSTDDKADDDDDDDAGVWRRSFDEVKTATFVVRFEAEAEASENLGRYFSGQARSFPWDTMILTLVRV